MFGFLKKLFRANKPAEKTTLPKIDIRDAEDRKEAAALQFLQSFANIQNYGGKSALEIKGYVELISRMGLITHEDCYPNKCVEWEFVRLNVPETMETIDNYRVVNIVKKRDLELIGKFSNVKGFKRNSKYQGVFLLILNKSTFKTKVFYFDSNLGSVMNLTVNKLSLEDICETGDLTSLVKYSEITSSELCRDGFKTNSKIEFHKDFFVKGLKESEADALRDIVGKLKTIDYKRPPKILLSFEEQTEFLKKIYICPNYDSDEGLMDLLLKHSKLFIDAVKNREIDLPDNIFVLGTLNNDDLLYHSDLYLCNNNLVMTFCEKDKEFKILFFVPAISPAVFESALVESEFTSSKLFQN